MAASVENETEISSFWDFKGQGDYWDTWFLLGKPYPVMLIVALYLLFVLKIGPAFMKNRPPMQLRNLLLAYNGAQVLISFYLFSAGVSNIMRYGLFHENCLYNNKDLKTEIIIASYWYLMAKITELLDTIFFVLRKKQNQVSFLHVYHHTFVVVCSWLLVKFGNTDDLIFIGTVNSFVHVVMYAYYALSAIPELRVFLWWKKYITTLQLVQFVSVLIQISISYIISHCPPSTLTMSLIFSQGFLFIYLFSDFYKKSYVEKENIKSKSKEEKLSFKGSNGTRNIFTKKPESKWQR